jgi:transcriptional/translational regulatory protein YebC/TACO1
VEGAEADRLIRLLDALEELDDVSKVFSNFDIETSELTEAET